MVIGEGQGYWRGAAVTGGVVGVAERDQEGAELGPFQEVALGEFVVQRALQVIGHCSISYISPGSGANGVLRVDVLKNPHSAFP